MLKRRLVLVPVAALLTAACSMGQPSAAPTVEPLNAPATATSFVPAVPPTATLAPSFLSSTAAPAPGGAAAVPAPGEGRGAASDATAVPSFLSTDPTSGTTADGSQPQPSGDTSGDSADATPATYTVQRGTVVDQVRLTGRVASVQQSLAFTTDGMLATLLVQPGARVKQGQLLAELDTASLSEQLRQAQVTYEQDKIELERSLQAARLEVESAKIELDAATDKLNQLREPASDAVAQARANLRQAQANLALIRNNASAEKSAAQKTMDAAASSLVYAQQKFAESKIKAEEDKGTLTEESSFKAYEEAALKLRAAEETYAKTQIAFETARGNEIAVVENAEALVDVAQAKLDTLLTPDKYLVLAAEREVERARLAVRVAQQRAQPDTGLTKQVADSEARINDLQSQIKAAQLVAPFAGLVGSVDITPGLPVRAGTPALMVVDPARMEIIAPLNTRDTNRTSADRLTVGQQVKVVFSRYGDRTFAGSISQVPARSVDTGQLTSSYHISFLAPGMSLDSGDSATVDITLGQRQNTLWLPAKAVRVTEAPFVIVPDGDGERRVNVEVGIVSTDRVEILSGLAEGDVVLSQ